MTGERKLPRLGRTEAIILAADVFYLIGFMLISTRLTVGTLEYVIFGLVLVSIGLVIHGALTGSAVLKTVFGIAQILIGAVVVLRYGIFFFTDLMFFASLMLFIALVGFGYVVISKIGELVTPAIRNAREEGRTPGTAS